MSGARLDCVIVGGGISGLAAAHRLSELGPPGLRVLLLEAGPRLGGHVRSERSTGMLLETGPDQFVRHKPAGLALCERLGLADELLAIDARRTATHVVRRGRPLRLPDSFSPFGPARLLPLARRSLLSWRGLARAACEPWIPARPAAVEDESLRSFVTRRFGREMHDRVFEPIFGGIFTADTGRLSVELAAPQLTRLEREHGSVLRALRRRGAPAGRGAAAGCLSLVAGLGRLVERLAQRLPPGWTRCDSPVDGLRRDARDGRWIVRCGNETLTAETVILACPSPVAGRLLEWDAPLAADLRRTEYASCATVHLAYPARAVGLTLDGFGFFVGRAEGLPLLACSNVSAKFPERVPPGRVLLRAFLGGAHGGDVLDLADEGLVRLAHAGVARLLRIAGEPMFARAQRFPASMPQLEVGFRARLARLAERARAHPGLVLSGGARATIGLPDCIESGETAAGDVLDQRRGRSALRHATPLSAEIHHA